MNGLSALLARVAADGLTLNLRGEGLAVAPAERLTPELRALLLRFKPEVLGLLRIHGPGLLSLFADAPSWPPPRGEFGLLADPDAVLRAIGRPVSLRDGREATLRAVLYETRSGLTLCRVEFTGGETLVLGAEQIFPLLVTVGVRGESA